MTRLPTNSDRLVIFGRTGSGKTQAAIFHLSYRNFDRMPWVVIDSKGDALLKKISKLPKANNITLEQTPKKPGLYFVRPIPEVDDEKLEEFLWRIHLRGKTGIYIDEGYMMPRGGPMNAILTQGRSKQVPVIMLAQRPVWMTKFSRSEASFFQVFELSDEDDRAVLRKFLPYDVVEGLPPYHSLWYDVGRKQTDLFSPVPDEETLLETFKHRLKEERIKFI